MTRNLAVPTRRPPPSGTPNTRTSTGLTSSPLLLLRRLQQPRSLQLLPSLPQVRSLRLALRLRRPRSASTTRTRPPRRRPSASARRRRRRPQRRPRRRRGRARPLRATATLTEQLQLRCEISIISASQQHHVVVRSTSDTTSDVHDKCVHIAYLALSLDTCSCVAYGKPRTGVGVIGLA